MSDFVETKKKRNYMRKSWYVTGVDKLTKENMHAFPVSVNGTKTSDAFLGRRILHTYHTEDGKTYIRTTFPEIIELCLERGKKIVDCDISTSAFCDEYTVNIEPCILSALFEISDDKKLQDQCGLSAKSERDLELLRLAYFIDCAESDVYNKHVSYDESYSTFDMFVEPYVVELRSRLKDIRRR